MGKGALHPYCRLFSASVNVVRLSSKGIFAWGLLVSKGFHGPASKLSGLFVKVFWGLRMFARFKDQSRLSALGRLASRP